MTPLPCAACGFLTVESNYGSYGICPVCDWEDDGVQLANPTSAGGANKQSLAAAQQAALAKLPLHIGSVGGVRRGSAWRPLSKAEIEAAEKLSASDLWHSRAIQSESEAYWRASEYSFKPNRPDGVSADSE